MSRNLKKRGFRFVGSTICYAFMQATGMVNDHLVTCPRHAEVAALGELRMAPLLEGVRGELPLDAAVHRFTVGDDPVTDLALVPHDCVASAAHARTLGSASRSLSTSREGARGSADAPITSNT